jgi:hypothetical protein
MYRQAAALALAAAAISTAGCGQESSDAGNRPVIGRKGSDSQAASALGFPAFATKNTTRVGGGDPTADAAAVAQAVFDAVADAIAAAGTVVSDLIKYALYLLNCALFALYRSFRDVLVLQAYAVPFTEELSIKKGALDLSTLWRSLGDLPAGQYPHEEIAIERARLFSSYNPAIPPTAPAEQPAVLFEAPYRPRTVISPHGEPTLVPTLPDAFIDAPRGKNDMFRENGPEPAAGTPPQRTFAPQRKNFGGALANSRRGVDLAEAGFPRGAALPDYNLDGDRGYAWPTWDVDSPPTPTSFGGDPLHPTHNPGGVATVRAVPAPD